MTGLPLRIAVAALLAGTLIPAATAADEPGRARERTGWRPGDVVSAEPFTARLVGGVPLPARAWRVVYTSRTATGGRTAVSGSVLVPNEPWTGAGSRPLLGFAVGTQGLADRCAPSAQLARGSEYEAPMIAQALARGWAVAVTDYPGLGTRGDHTYVVERANGKAVLDSMRAARRLSPAGLAPRGPNVIYGYSEGGGAAGGAIELQPTYAPGLRLRGAYVGAAPADFRALFDHVDGSPIAFLMGYAAIGYQRAYPDLDLDRYLTPAGRDALARLRNTCIHEAVVAGLLMPRDVSAYFTADPFAIPALRRRFRQNRLGRVAPRTPVLLGAARNDEVIPFPVMTALVDRYCRLGADAHFRAVPLAEHLSGAIALAPAAMQFLDDRLAGEPLPRATGC